VALWLFWHLRNHDGEGREQYRRLLELDGEVSPPSGLGRSTRPAF
jgi:hypothetical protein